MVMAYEPQLPEDTEVPMEAEEDPVVQMAERLETMKQPPEPLALPEEPPGEPNPMLTITVDPLATSSVILGGELTLAEQDEESEDESEDAMQVEEEDETKPADDLDRDQRELA